MWQELARDVIELAFLILTNRLVISHFVDILAPSLGHLIFFILISFSLLGIVVTHLNKKIGILKDYLW